MHLMIDIETLDTINTAVVPQVGWVGFNMSGVATPYEMSLDIEEQLTWGRTISADTLKWWMSQPKEARQRVFQADKIHSIEELGSRLRTIIDDCQVQHVWSHGPAFDIAILQDLLGTEVCHRRMLRDTRTLAMLAPDIDKTKPRVPHSAGEDAYVQAWWVINMLQSLGYRG